MYGVDQTGAVTTVLLTLSNPTVPQQPAGTVTNNNSEKLPPSMPPACSYTCFMSCSRAVLACLLGLFQTRLAAQAPPLFKQVA